MNRKAVVEGREYRLLETVPSLTGQEQFVLCEDANGSKFICPEELWSRHTPSRNRWPLFTREVPRRKKSTSFSPCSAGAVICMQSVTII